MHYFKWSGLPLLLAALLMLHGCSVKTMYNQLDWLLLGAVEDFVTLDSEQERMVQQRITQLLQWHRHEEVPNYVQDLQQIKLATADGLSEAELETIFKGMHARWIALRARASADITEMLLTTSAKQQAEIYAELANRNREIREEYEGLSEHERLHRIEDRLIEHFERWLGDLDKSQIRYLRAQAKTFQPFHAERMAFRENWQAAFRAILDSPADTATRLHKLNELFNNPAALQSPAYRDKLADNLARTRQIILAMDKTLSTAQKTHLQERIDYFIRMFQDIATGK